ncbi:MAG: hypothetical protein JWM68_2943 [Verrucomicrobiales bacterium]|nr:hypothetical protein [Verrucomicrobiales bacterium]
MNRISQWFLKQPEHIRSGLVLILLTGLILAGFWEVTHCDFVNFDDTEYLTENFHVQQGVTWKQVAWALQSNHAGNWHPLTWISHMIDWSLYGAKAAGHHFTNLLFHIGNTLLLFLILKEMTKALWKSAFVAALFAIHPMHVESVAWISERKDVLSAFFALLTIWFYWRYADWKRTATANGGEGVDAHRKTAKLHYFLALVCFSLGLMSKPMLVTLPFVLLLLDFWPLERMGDFDSLRAAAEKIKVLLLEKWLFFVLTMAASVTTFLVQRNAGAMGSNYSLPNRLANAFASYVVYIGKLLWPLDLAVFYPLSPRQDMTRALCSFLVIACISLLVLMRAKTKRYIFTGWFWFVGMLVPVIGFVQVGIQAMADRYSYLPAIGLFILIAWGAGECLKKVRLLPFLATAVVIACTLLTQRQVSFWQNSATLFSHVFAVTRKTPVSHIQLGAALGFCRRYEEAIPYFERAAKLDPESDLAHLDWGIVLIAMGKNEEAATHLQQSIRLNPDVPSAHDNLGIALTHLKRYTEAESEYRRALKLAPGNPAVLSRLAFSLMEQKKFDEAEPIFLQALRLNSSLQEAHIYLGFIYVTEKRFDEAIEHCIAAVRINPNDVQAQNNLQTVISRKREAQESAVKVP